MTQVYTLNNKQKQYILEQSKLHTISFIMVELFGDKFTMEQSFAVYTFMESNHCFDYVYNVSFHNEVLRLAKLGLQDGEIYEQLKDKYENIGPFQVSAVVIANTQARRFGRWQKSEQRLLGFLYGILPKTAFLQAFYPRLLTNIQKQASRLNLNYEKPVTDKEQLRTKIPVGELRKVLEEYGDDEFFSIICVGNTELVPIVNVGHKLDKEGNHKNPQITIWNS